MAHGKWTRREFFRRSAAMGAVALGGPVALSACQATGGGGDTLQTARESGSIRIGIANEQPYGFADATGKVTGEAPEVATAVCKAMGIGSVENQVVSFGQLIPALNAGKFDLVTAGMFITPERCGQAAFSIPDYTTRTALLVPKGNPKGLKTFAEVAAKKATVAVLSGAVEKDYALGAGVEEGNTTTLDTQDAMLRSVIDGRVDCAALTDISLNWLVKQNPDAGVEVTQGFDIEENGKPVVQAGGFVFRKDDNPLREEFNKQLRQLQDSGEWLRIVEPFGFGEDNVPGAGVTTESLCGAA